jgi:hypothetical protein
MLRTSERERRHFLTEMTLAPPQTSQGSTETPILITEAATSSEMALTSYHIARFTTKKVAVFVKTCTIFSLFRRVRKIAKNDYKLRLLCLSVCLSAWNNSASTGRIFMEIDI